MGGDAIQEPQEKVSTALSGSPKIALESVKV